ncbi:hypothetical protein F5X68DRAFT_189123 [Plectosphaerella plurivora]|uniref:Uncharacterized protein n=1 Tax=Plectosphaerella plurivora TaxID=936078 RepID=A0A9P8VEU4_9PEZI|nr:hypothetical protein F5X68DRAFT_189123 [Plectosphaerella plurivora]
MYDTMYTIISILIEAVIGILRGFTPMPLAAIIYGIICSWVSRLPLWLAGRHAAEWDFFTDMAPSAAKVILRNSPWVGPLLDPFIFPVLQPQPGASEVRVVFQTTVIVCLLFNADLSMNDQLGRSRLVKAVVKALRAWHILAPGPEVVPLRQGRPRGIRFLAPDVVLLRAIDYMETWHDGCFDDTYHALAVGMYASVDTRWPHQVWDLVVLSPYLQERRAVDESTLGRLGVPVICVVAGLVAPESPWYAASILFFGKFALSRTFRPFFGVLPIPTLA